MKKIPLLLIAMMLNIFAFAGADVKLVITNLSKQKVSPYSIVGDWQSGLVVGDIPYYIRESIEVNQTLTIITRCNWGCGADGQIYYASEDGKGKFVVIYDNPSIGSSEYSTQVFEGNYTVVITSTNTDVNPQVVNIEIRGGDETPPKPRYNLTTTGRNTIKGSIMWDEKIQGMPSSTDWNNIFRITCTVPAAFQVADNGPVTYNNEKGYYMGSVQSGTVLFTSYVTSPGTTRVLNFTIINIAENLQINKFDVEVRDGVQWIPPVGSAAPSPTYKFLANTNVYTPIRFTSLNTGEATYDVVTGWCEPVTGDISKGGGLKEAMQATKLIKVLPPDAFTNINNAKNNFKMDVKSSNIKLNESIKATNLKGATMKGNIKVGNKF
jgi:hypothetical protein